MAWTALEQIKNFYVLDDDVATGGQPAPDQFAAIKNAGFDVVINLALADSPGAVINEGKIIHALGMVYEHIPVDFKHPALDDLDLFFHRMGQHREKKIFVHCAYNWRVACFMFLYRAIKCRCPVAAALHDLHAVWQPDPVWQNFIEAALDSYNIKD
jgi:protein tyrosine phosphatase (PTP) superfamily phosphohydrolase (DUF442 family)